MALTDVACCRMAAAGSPRNTVRLSIKAPMLDIRTVGAGGGSVAYIDSGGLTKVSPRSSGADPGPPGRPGSGPSPAPTSTRRRTCPPAPAGRPHEDPGESGNDRTLAERLGPASRKRRRVLSVVTANMARAIRVISVQRGHDPRDYTLMAFGGAGPLHAARLAKELEIGRVLVPANPGILCAMGLLLTDLRADFALTRLLPATEGSTADVAESFAALAERADRWFEHEAIARHHRRLTRTVDMRYHGQNYELRGAGRHRPPPSIPDRRFHRRPSPAPWLRAETSGQIVTLRLEAVGRVRKAELRAHAEAGADASTAITGRRPVWFPETGDFVATPIYARDALQAGNCFKGPAVVEQMDATTLVPPGMTARIDAWLNLILETA
jgi:N-methylhydantoinase A